MSSSAERTGSAWGAVRAKGEQRERKTAPLRLQEGTIASSKRLSENLHAMGGGRTEGQGEDQGRAAELQDDGADEGTTAPSKSRELRGDLLGVRVARRRDGAQDSSVCTYLAANAQLSDSSSVVPAIA